MDAICCLYLLCVCFDDTSHDQRYNIALRKLRVYPTYIYIYIYIYAHAHHAITTQVDVTLWQSYAHTGVHVYRARVLLVVWVYRGGSVTA